MALAAQLKQSTVLTPRERERAKGAQQRAEDVIYTLNHTFTCLSLTDLLVVPVLRAFGMNIGHTDAKTDSGDHAGHDHGPVEPPAAKPLSDAERLQAEVAKHPAKPAKGQPGMFSRLMGKSTPGSETERSFTEAMLPHAPNCADPAHGHGAPTKARPKLWGRIKGEVGHAFSHIGFTGHWFAGELIGDVGAAFVTIPVQRYMPGLMDGLRRGMEPVVGGFFQRGAQRSAQAWADKHGLAHDNEAVVARAQELYQYEMRHLPQMAVWTGSSIALHYGAMRVMEKGITLGEFSRMKAAGAGITALTVFGARALAPDKAHAWDQTAGKHVVVPLTKSAGKLFGIKERDVDDYHARQKDDDAMPQSWAARVKEPAAPVLETARGA